MKIACISDIHSNLVALESVLADIRHAQPDLVVCLGDIVGYGPQPAECLDLVKNAARICVMGNHDVYVAQNLPLQGVREDVADGILLATNALDESQLTWLRGRPLTSSFGDCSFVHSSLSQPAFFPYVHDSDDALAHFEEQKTTICFQGHSHIPGVWIYAPGDSAPTFFPPAPRKTLPGNARCLVNVGSVGQPRDGDPRACYTLYDNESHELTWRRICYDVAATVQSMISLGMPEYSASRLFQGI
ncbi:MAG: metallophosphoesterase family protein [Terrimicrobiaceae bacterium]